VRHREQRLPWIDVVHKEIRHWDLAVVILGDLWHYVGAHADKVTAHCVNVERVTAAFPLTSADIDANDQPLVSVESH
jgi:hypothetical protein